MYIYIYVESLLVIRDLGIQVKTVYMTGIERSRFIEQSKIADIIINEGVTMQQVVFYIAIIVKDQKKMALVFEHFLPRLQLLLQVYRGARAIIYGESEYETEGC
jgi:hypothetical protein